MCAKAATKLNDFSLTCNPRLTARRGEER